MVHCISVSLATHSLEQHKLHTPVLDWIDFS